MDIDIASGFIVKIDDGYLIIWGNQKKMEFNLNCAA